uniref:Uncharacterized protein n=1 Tax=Arundo donax TaxID=35708 RepID=A0A0A9GGN3_ARUDO
MMSLKWIHESVKNLGVVPSQLKFFVCILRCFGASIVLYPNKITRCRCVMHACDMMFVECV